MLSQDLNDEEAPRDDLREECPQQLTMREPCRSGVFQRESARDEPADLGGVQSLADDEGKV